jgi:hypothetical protein
LRRRTLRHYAKGVSPIFYHVPMEIFLFNEMGKKRVNKKRIVYIKGGSDIRAYS